MEYRNQLHEDMSLFRNRLWKLMEQKKIGTVKQLAKVLYDAGLVKVNQKDNFNSPEANLNNAIGSVEKKIQTHLNADTCDRLQGEYVLAYCTIFGCSADYLFGRSDIVSGNIDVRRFCECTGLSEKAVKRLIEELPEAPKKDLMQFWSEILDTNAFYGLPLEWRQMCIELGQYYAAQNQIKKINKASQIIDDANVFAETWRSMMEENYLKEAEPHAGAYYIHLSSIIANMTEFLEKSAEAYAIRNKLDIDGFFFQKMRQKFDADHKKFSEHIDSEAEE